MSWFDRKVTSGNAPPTRLVQPASPEALSLVSEFDNETTLQVVRQDGPGISVKGDDNMTAAQQRQAMPTAGGCAGAIASEFCRSRLRPEQLSTIRQGGR